MDDRPDEKTLSDLNTLIDISRQLGATIELDPLLKSIEQAAIRLLECERVSVFIYDRGRHELYSRLATGVEAIRFSADRGIAGETARNGGVINVADAYADSRFNPDVDKRTGFHTRNVLCIAMDGYDGHLIGVLQFLNKRNGSFSTIDETLAGTFGALAGVAIQRQLLLEEAALGQKLERELSLAQQIQRDYLPQTTPKVAGYDLAGWNRPADQTGGDAYDFFAIAPQRLGLFIADASGHGIGPALVVAECRALIRALASTTMDLQQIISEANSVLYEDLREGRFVTACFALLDGEAGTIECMSAGHAPLLHYVSLEDRFEKISANTLPMAVVDDLPLTASPPLQFAAGDLFILITDGFYEWRRPDGEQFGMERLLEVIRTHRDRPCAEIIGYMRDAVVDFSQGTTQPDDLTAIVLKREDPQT